MASAWFLFVDGIAGDSAVEGHEGDLEVSAWAWGLSSTQSPASVTGTGRPILDDLVVTLSSNAGALQLARSCAIGRQAETARLTGVRAGANRFTFLRYELQRVAITSVRQVADQGDEVQHQIALRFRGLRATAIPQNPDGSPGNPLTVEVGNL